MKKRVFVKMRNSSRYCVEFGLQKKTVGFLSSHTMSGSFTTCDEEIPAYGRLFLSAMRKNFKMSCRTPRPGKYKIELLLFDHEYEKASPNEKGLLVLAFYLHSEVILSTKTYIPSCSIFKSKLTAKKFRPKHRKYLT